MPPIMGTSKCQFNSGEKHRIAFPWEYGNFGSLRAIKRLLTNFREHRALLQQLTVAQLKKFPAKSKTICKILSHTDFLFQEDVTPSHMRVHAHTTANLEKHSVLHICNYYTSHNYLK